ncbi:MAG: tRNA uridine-5-carboxymethylaminomethyl(34) synthesis enzyme MnmG [Candidatus Vidania fulgoroideorum]
MKFKVIIVGGGNAGIEASNICSKISSKILLITNNIDNIGKLSCNPAIGGIGKSQLVKEIDIFGGLMGSIADISCNNSRILNTSKGYSVRSTRIQVDKYLYPLEIKKKLTKIENLTIIQENLKKILIKNNKVIGILTENKTVIKCNSVILTVGTFMRNKIFSGKKCYKNSRDNENYYNKISKYLNKYIPGINRFKTGTPPRINKNTINYKILKKQINTKESYFSLINNKKINNKLDCWITNTTKKTKNYIIKNIKKSSIYSGKLKYKGPSYCPSIEDKFIKFNKKKQHKIFLEEESIYSNEIYPSGLSTSFDIKSQKEIVNSVKGLENSIITRYGFAISYDYFNPKYLKKTLESKYINGLFMAGQINGTTGYEEAAAQGIYAGINAIRYIKQTKPFYLNRNHSYIGILIDDIVKKGIKEPYRMFTSRAENRINIREDNVIDRLLEISFKNKFINKNKYKKLKNIKKNLNKIITITKKSNIKYGKNKTNLFNLIKNNKNIDIKYIFKKKLIKNTKIYKKLKKYSKSNIENYINSEIKYYPYIKKNIKNKKVI